MNMFEGLKIIANEEIERAIQKELEKVFEKVYGVEFIGGSYYFSFLYHKEQYSLKGEIEIIPQLDKPSVRVVEYFSEDTGIDDVINWLDSELKKDLEKAFPDKLDFSIF